MKFSHKGFNPDYTEEAPTFEQVCEWGGDAIIEFGAPWCEHCQRAVPAIKEVLTAYSDMPHIKIHDGKGKPLGRAFKVKLWPTLILLQDGKETARLVRPINADQVRRLLSQSSR